MENDDFISSPLNVHITYNSIQGMRYDNVLSPSPLTEGTTTVCSAAVYSVVAAHLCWSGDTSSVLVTPPPRHQLPQQQQQRHGLINM